jgi:hypothetical protein
MPVQLILNPYERVTTQAERDRLWRDTKTIAEAIAAQWSFLDAHSVDRIAHDRGLLIVCIRNRFGLCGAEAERRVRDWEDRLLSRG